MGRGSQPRVVQLTPPGRGAVATLLIDGPGAVELLEGRFRANGDRGLKTRSVDQLVVGRFGGETGEEVVARRHADGCVELHCHGGQAAIARIERALVEQGCRAVPWQDWAADHYQDPIAAAALSALAEARTERTAAILLDQYNGALRRALEAIQRAITRDDPSSARELIDGLLARADVGRHLVRPWRVVLAGRPNVGKSSLINALVGYPRAIVHHAPGTTRDVVTAQAAVDGWPVELSDTAGLQASDDVVERAGVELARARLSRADLAILVFDASTTWSTADEALVRSWPGGLVVHNKGDLAAGTVPRRSGQVTSAPTGHGIDALARAIADRLVTDPPPAGAAVPFTEEQVQYLADLGTR